MIEYSIRLMKRMIPEELEREHVQKVYDEIDPHFSSTRYKAWPGVVHFIETLSPNSLLLDVGCGNGKNLGIRKDIIDIGTDISIPLCEIAHQRKNEIFGSTALNLQIKSNIFDSVICIAVIHHFASYERRVQCLKEISRVLKVGGTAFVTAWATKQSSKTYSEQDQMISWQMDKRWDQDEKQYERFYHFFVEGEFKQLIQDIPELVLQSETWEAGNWQALFVKQSIPANK